MRVISGHLKGKKIFLPTDNLTRPLKDLVKESIFNIIKHSKNFNSEIDGSEILDLFSGVGSFGIECISRGAKKVTFVENHSSAIKTLTKNINLMKCERNADVFTDDAFKLISKQSILLKKYDFIFLDPPYKEKKISKLISDLINLKILKDNGCIIIHRHKKQKDLFSENFKIIKTASYGLSKIIFF